MPPGPIVDSHVHLWDPTRFRMPWLDGNERIGKPFGLAEFREHSAGVDVEGIVYLQVEVTPPGEFRDEYTCYATLPRDQQKLIDFLEADPTWPALAAAPLVGVAFSLYRDGPEPRTELEPRTEESFFGPLSGDE